ncbi:hypothetical protein DPMN_154754 [Dreissena polymorpha]|uniref:B box-type domain-containing protein n=1 Tax=Dreissena polymorpha TaxID=45954 RepID=A0A9D4J9E5_DREPO|nr:hypothetical protein DPMN_154754 [Dreissena polymorpha]
MEDSLLKCDVHKENKLETFCQDHQQLCCSVCVLLNHRQCCSVIFISDSVKKMSPDMRHLSINLQTILDELNKFKSTQEASIQYVDVSYSEKLQEIQDLRNKLNAALDVQEKTTMKELDEIRSTLQTTLKNDLDNCSRLKDELKQISEAVNVLYDKGKKEIEFIAYIKCLEKIQESKTYLKKNRVDVQSSIIFKANIAFEKYLFEQERLGMIVDSMQSLRLKMNPDQMMTVKRISEYSVRISSDTRSNSGIGVCCLPSGQVIVTDSYNKKVKMLNEQYHVSSHCDVPCSPEGICQITSSEVAVNSYKDVQFISVINGQLVNGRKVQLQHAACGIAHHQGSLYVTSGSALYHYTLDGSLLKKLYEDTGYYDSVFKCAVSPDGDRIYVTNNSQHKLITLATDGTLISTFKDPKIQSPWGVHATPSGQVIVVGAGDNSLIQVDHEGKNKLAASQRLSATTPTCTRLLLDLVLAI